MAKTKAKPAPAHVEAASKPAEDVVASEAPAKAPHKKPSEVDFSCAATVAQIMALLGRDGALRSDSPAYRTMLGITMMKDGSCHIATDVTERGEDFNYREATDRAIADSGFASLHALAASAK